MPDCEFCDDSFESIQMLRTHVLLRHRDRIQDSDEYDIELSEGSLETRDHPKGEQFGYSK